MFKSLSDNLIGIVNKLIGTGRLTQENINETIEKVHTCLLEADVALPVINTFLENVKTKAIGQELLKSIKPGNAFVKIVYDELVKILGESCAPINLQTQPPAIIMMAGLQGCGKTTTAAKLAYWIKTTQKKSVLLTTTDIYRPAAAEQLQFLANQIDAEYFPNPETADPVTIASSAINHAKNKFIDTVIIDTAGRLHIDQEMMQELQYIQAATNPIEKLLVVDGMMGQDAINTAKIFTQTIQPTGIIITKTDGDARGGVALSMRLITNKPIKFIGTGEKIEGLEIFHPDRIASRILGMGDILTLVEEAQQKIDHEKAKKLANKFQKGKAFDLEDFLTQLKQMRNMGGISNLLGKLPGLGNLDQIKNNINEQMFTKMEAIINSMTPKERRFPAFIKGSNKQRIAGGSGTQVQDINRLLKQFEHMQKMMHRMSGGKMMEMIKNLKGAFAK